MQALVDFLDKLFQDFTWKRLVGLLFLATIVIVGVFFYNAQTGTVELSKYERALSILERLELVKPSGEQQKVILDNILRGLVEITDPTGSDFLEGISFSIQIENAFWAALPWLLIALVFLKPLLRGDDDSAKTFIGLIVVAGIVGAIGYFIPDSLPRWLYPIFFNLALLMMLVWLGNRGKK